MAWAGFFVFSGWVNRLWHLLLHKADFVNLMVTAFARRQPVNHTKPKPTMKRCYYPFAVWFAMAGMHAGTAKSSLNCRATEPPRPS